MRVVRFYVSLPASFLHLLPPPSSAGPQLQALDRSVPPLDQSVPCRTSTASSGSECSPPDLNCELRIRVFPAGPHPRIISEDITPDDNARKNVRRYFRYYLPQYFSSQEAEQPHQSRPIGTCQVGSKHCTFQGERARERERGNGKQFWALHHIDQTKCERTHD